MDTLEAIRKRRSIRKYTDNPITKTDLETIVDAGRLAATGSNQQPWDFIVVTDRTMIGRFTVSGAWIEKAIAVIVVVMDQVKDAYLELKEYFRLFDPLHEQEEAVFEKLGYIDIQFLAARVQSQVLWGIGLADTICPPSTQFAVYNKVSSPKDMAIFPDFGHEWIPGFQDQVFQFMMGL